MIDVGPIVFYENGTAHLEALMNGDGIGSMSADESYFFYSKTLNSAIFTKLNKVISVLDKQGIPKESLKYCLQDRSKQKFKDNWGYYIR